jgi:hypothetical protein
MSIMTKTLNTADLAQFTGSENWYRHGLNRTVLFTDGANMSPTRPGLTGSSMRSHSFSHAARAMVKPDPSLQIAAAGLLKPSVIKPVLATLDQHLVRKTRGQLSETDRFALKAALQVMLG